jgi:hypothetical protein
MAVQSARPGHNSEIIIEPSSREGPRTRYAGSVGGAAVTGEVLPMDPAYRPMLATLVDEPFDDKRWVFEANSGRTKRA